MCNYWILIIASFLGTSDILSQINCDYRYDNQWVLGDKDNLIEEDEFGGCIIQFLPIFSSRYHFKHQGQTATVAVINSKSGNLLFYSNGCNIFDYRDSIILNGDGINPGEIHDEYCPGEGGYPGVNNMFFLPNSYDTSIYYLFHIREIYNWDPDAAFIVQYDNMYITTLHTSKNNGYGEVIKKNEIVFSDTAMIGKPITAVKHANGLDWWIITPERWSNGFHTVLIDQHGFHYVGKQFEGNPPHPRSSGGQGKFSPDGAKFAWYQPRNGLFVYDFDRTTGILSNFRLVEIPIGASLITGGLEFSPSGRFLYINDYFSLYQVDMTVDDLQSSLTHIADYDGFGDPPLFTVFYNMERTPDNRIIMNVRNGSQWLHVIQEPERKGVACRFEQHSIKLPTVNNFTLPHFPNYRLGALGEPLCDSIPVSVTTHTINPSPLYSIRPNPTTTYLQIDPIESTNRSDVDIWLVNSLGESILQSSDWFIDVCAIPPGLYFIQIYHNGIPVQQTKVVIQ